MFCVAKSPCGRGNSGSKLSASLWKFIHPSRSQPTVTNFFTVGEAGSAFSISSCKIGLSKETIIFTSAALFLYSMSFTKSCSVAGTAIAPILCNATIKNQNS